MLAGKGLLFLKQMEGFVFDEQTVTRTLSSWQVFTNEQNL